MIFSALTYLNELHKNYSDDVLNTKTLDVFDAVYNFDVSAKNVSFPKNWEECLTNCSTLYNPLMRDKTWRNFYDYFAELLIGDVPKMILYHSHIRVLTFEAADKWFRFIKNIHTECTLSAAHSLQFPTFTVSDWDVWFNTIGENILTKDNYMEKLKPFETLSDYDKNNFLFSFMKFVEYSNKELSKTEIPMYLIPNELYSKGVIALYYFEDKDFISEFFPKEYAISMYKYKYRNQELPEEIKNNIPEKYKQEKRRYTAEIQLFKSSIKTN